MASGIPTQRNREFPKAYQGKFFKEQGNFQPTNDGANLSVSVHCSHTSFAPAERDLFSLAFLQSEEEQMADGGWSRERYGEAFWRAHHEAWRQSDLNQREYCEAHGLSLKAFGNWRAKFKAEPQPRPRKLLYRRGGLSHRLGHTLGHSVSHMTNGSPEQPLIIPLARDGHRRTFSEADKRRIVEQAGVRAENLNPDVLVMQPASQGV